MLTHPMHSRTAWDDYFTGSATLFKSNEYGTTQTAYSTNVRQQLVAMCCDAKQTVMTGELFTSQIQIAVNIFYTGYVEMIGAVIRMACLLTLQ
jgi:hypothetical protein